jgi:NADP-dependent 3-hydroxy acid dehydrogenase YdfG
MHPLKSKIALISGASSGIGRSMAHQLAMRGCELILIARRKEKLQEVRLEILKDYPLAVIHLLVFDVNDPTLYTELKKNWIHIDILINNAGLALGRDKFEATNFDEQVQVLNTNITASFKMVHTLLPGMLERGEGDIINLCSVAGHLTYQGGAIYCASKHAVSAFTKSVREETCGRNVRVMQISPGMVETEFSKVRFRGDEKAADAVYANMNPITPDDIARMMVFMLEQPRHVTIDEIITMATDQGAPTYVVRRNP